MKQSEQLDRSDLTQADIIKTAVNAISPTKSGVRFLPLDQVILIHAPESTAGTPVTYRTIDELERDLPTTKKHLREAKGKVVFLGNGLSDAPVFALTQSPNNEIVVNDTFSYPLLWEDMDNLYDELSKHNSMDAIQLPFERFQILMEAIKEGRIKSIQYVVGSGTPPIGLCMLR